MNLQKALSSLWTMLTRTRMMRFAVTILAILATVRYIRNARSGRHAAAAARRGGTRRQGASSSRARNSRRSVAPAGSGQRGQRANDEDVKNRSPRDVYLKPSRRRYQICISTSCVFSDSVSLSEQAVASSKRVHLSISTSGDDEHKVDANADVSSAEHKLDANADVPSFSSPSEPEMSGSKTQRLCLASKQCGAILAKLCEHHDLYLVCQLSGLLSSSSPSSHQQASSGDSESAFSSSSTLASHDEATKVVIDFCRELCLFDAGLKKHRVVFCTTDVGRTAIMRQLEPHLLIEDDAQNAQQLAKVLPNSRVVVTRSLEQKNSRVTDVDGFERFFAKSS